MMKDGKSKGKIKAEFVNLFMWLQILLNSKSFLQYAVIIPYIVSIINIIFWFHYIEVNTWKNLAVDWSLWYTLHKNTL